MERIAVFVDAGYFWVQVSHLLYGEIRNRRDIVLDCCMMRDSLRLQVEDYFSNFSLLRIYWYDGLGYQNQPTQQHKLISMMNDFKIRYGTINTAGQQKAVDGLIIADLLSLAQNKAISSALLVSGDADLSPGVFAAQMLGVRVHMLEIGSSNASSPVLQETVDEKDKWPDNEIRRFAHKNMQPDYSKQTVGNEKQESNNLSQNNLQDPFPDKSSNGISNIQTLQADTNMIIAEQFIKTLKQSELNSIKSDSMLEPEIDKKLISIAQKQLSQRVIDKDQLKNLRWKVKKLVSKMSSK